MDIVLRTLTEDDLDAAYQLRVGAFSAETHGTYPAEGEHYVPTGRQVGAFLDDRLVGQAAAWRFGSWLLGRRVPMAGVAGVTSAPEARGHGVARAMLRAMVEIAIAEGDVISCLYPSAPGLYRSLGWENAGHRLTRRLPTVALRDLPRPDGAVTVRALAWPEDVPTASAILDEQARTGHGCVDRSEPFHARLLGPERDRGRYVAERDGAVTGVLVLQKSPAEPGDGHVSFRQAVLDLAATDHDSWLALWRLVASNAPVCTVTSWRSSPADPLLDHLELAAVDTQLENLTWMARVLDAPAAVAARGWPRGLDVTVDLHLEDEWLDRNDGDWVLTIADGEGRLEPGGTGASRVPVGPFSQLVTGHTSASALRRSRRLVGPDAAVHDLDEAFRAPPPFMRVYF